MTLVKYGNRTPHTYLINGTKDFFVLNGFFHWCNLRWSRFSGYLCHSFDLLNFHLLKIMKSFGHKLLLLSQISLILSTCKFFKKIFWCRSFFTVFIKSVTILLLFYVLVFWPWGMWDLSSPTKDWTCTPCIGRQDLHHWTTREILVKWVKVIQLCPTLCDPMDYTVLVILQARKMEWVAFPFSRASSQPKDWTQVSLTVGGFFTSWATREALGSPNAPVNLK